MIEIQVQKLRIGLPFETFPGFLLSGAEFVSDFDIRISDLSLCGYVSDWGLGFPAEFLDSGER
jgi:hypothetical protein